ncbi:MAG: nitroreductase family protein [Promethearchaeota archaeon]|jgi:nitroreductase/NAD-dependent dihydropyrimidine dehydrogenase PreA subunit
MPIIGIDKDKCTNCKSCLKDCPTKNFSLDKNQKQVLFDNIRCIICGHCIGVCPENAILYDNMEDEVFEFKEGKIPSELISYSSIHQLMRSIRSIRQYKKQEVPHEAIDKVIDSMRYAPTGGNMRNLKCLIFTSANKINLLSNSIINALEYGEAKDRLTQRRDAGFDPIFYKAPCVLILYSKNPWDTRNVTIAMTYGMISAQTLGLGCCWIGYAHGILMEYPSMCKKMTGIETNVLGVMTLGYPSVKYYRSPPRPPLGIKEDYDIN